MYSIQHLTNVFFFSAGYCLLFQSLHALAFCVVYGTAVYFTFPLIWMTPQTFKKGTCKSRYDFKQQKGLDYGKGAGPLLPGGRKFNQISQHYLLYLFDSENLFFRLSCGAEKGLNNATHYGNFLSVHTSFLMPSPQTFKWYEHFWKSLTSMKYY